MHTKCLLKRVFSKRKEFAPKGSKFFSFRVDPFPEGSQNIFIKLPSLKDYPFPLRTGNIKSGLYDICNSYTKMKLFLNRI